jgi:phage terminase large subunit-like protein
VTEVLDPWAIAANLIDPPEGSWKPQPHQVPPPGNWFGWLMMGGRGTGKTASSSQYFYDHCMGPPCDPSVPGGHWPSIIAPTLGDAVTSCVNGPSGLKAINPGIKVRVTSMGTIAVFPNGVEVKLFGASSPEDVERLRSGGNRCCAWLEELAAWRYMDDCFQHMRYGLRLGLRPHWIASTTPKARKLIRELVKKAREGIDGVVMTHGTTDDNPHLPQHIRDMLYEDYGGTRLGRQELSGELLDDVENALWNPTTIEEWRLKPTYMPRHFDRIAVGVDPAGGGDDEHGIIVAGMIRHWEPLPHLVNDYSHLAHGFILGDYSCQGSPKEWADEVIKAYKDWAANLVVGEINFGGPLVQSNLHSIDPTLPFEDVWASRGKARRAEPVSNMYQQGRIHHVGVFGQLEDQMCNFDAVEPDPSWSPDRMDAMVWVMSKLLPPSSQFVINGTVDTRLRATR